MKKSLTCLLSTFIALALVFVSCSSGSSKSEQTIAVTGVSLDKAALTLNIGAQETLTVTIQPSNATNKAVTWMSNDTGVATVSGGVVTAVSAGTANITVTTQDGGRSATCFVTVEPDVAVTGLSLNKNTMILTVGGSETLAPAIQPGNAKNQNVTWASGNTAIATVSNGTVAAVSPGTATITATTQDGNHTANCVVTVATQSLPVSGLTLNKNTMTLAVGDTTGTLVPAIAPINATNQNVTWTSSNTTVATVTARGVVTPVSVGNAIIRATTQDGGKTTECTLTVVTAPIPAIDAAPNKYDMALSEGNNEAFTATFIPANATNQNIVWTSSDTDIAVVSSSGVVTAIAPGTVTITASSDAGITTPASSHMATDNGSNTVGSKVRSGGVSIFPAPLTVTVSSAPVHATGVTLNKNALALTVGNYETLIPAVSPSNSTNQGVNWLSSDTSIAVVSSSGVVTAVNEGFAVVTVATRDGGRMDTCNVTVAPAVTPIHPSGVYLDRPALTLQPGSTERLTATVLPDNASNKNVYWSSGNNAVAVVSSNGVVTAVADGAATITVATVDGGRTAACSVSVSSTVSVTGVALNKNSTSLTVGDTETLTATVLPENAANKTVTWASSNTGVATVVNGLVTAVSQGTATIMVMTQDGGHTAICAVTVSAAVGSVEITAHPGDRAVVIGVPFSWQFNATSPDGVNQRVQWRLNDGSGPDSTNAAPGGATISVNGLMSILLPYDENSPLYVSPGDRKLFLGVMAITENGAKAYATFYFDVYVGTPVTGVSLNKNTMSLAVGDTETLTPTVQPENAANKTVTWISSNANVATVNGSGLVTAQSQGTATIMVTTQDGGHTAICAVTVVPPSSAGPDVYIATVATVSNTSQARLFKNG